MDVLGTIMFYAAHITLALLVGLLVLGIKFRKKTKLSKYLLAYIVELLVWTASVVAREYLLRAGKDGAAMIFEDLTYVGVAFIAATVLLMGISFNSTYQKKLLRMILVCAIPMFTQIVIWSGHIFGHGWFYKSYDFYDPSKIVLGWYFWVHTVYSYGCLIIGMSLIIKFAFNSNGNSRWQAILIIIGSLIPLIVNICYTLGVRALSVFASPIAFLITMVAYLIGIFRFNLLRTTPIALRTVIDRISDLYIVIDDYMRILDYNAPFAKIFGEYAELKKNMNIHRLIDANKIGIVADNFFSGIDYCRETNAVFSNEFRLLFSGAIKFYNVEFTPLVIENTYCGCILLLRDITRAKADMEEIRRNQNRLVERERLASLGQLTGGIAHNIKTPLLAVSGRIESIYALIGEYEESIGAKGVTKDDHAEIANEMRQEAGKIKNHISYISDIISAVKAQTVKFSAEMKESFTVDELLKRVGILLQHELISKNCELKVEMQSEGTQVLSGDITSLVQVLDNIIINAIQAYNGAAGKITLKVWKEKPQPELHIVISDNAGGIPIEIQDRLFRQMVTTKGASGTGLGLYISYSTVVGMFGGKMSFTSVENKGTAFTIILPLERGEAGV